MQKFPELSSPVSLKTPTGRSSFTAHEQDGVVIVSSGRSAWRYRASCLPALRDELRRRGGWVPLGSRGEEEVPPEGSVEAWARQGRYGLTSGRSGRFASFVPPILEYLGWARVEHKGRNNRMRAR